MATSEEIKGSVTGFLDELNAKFDYHGSTFDNLSQVTDFIHQLNTRSLELERININSKLKYSEQYETIKTLKVKVEEYKTGIDNLATLQSQVKKKDEEIKSLKVKIEEYKKQIDTCQSQDVENNNEEQAIPQKSHILFEQRFNEVVRQRDEALKNCQKKDLEVKSAQEQVAELSEKINSAPGIEKLQDKMREGTVEVVLEQRNASNKYGVHFATRKGNPSIKESRIIVQNIDRSIVGENVGEGDFVIEINGQNTQLAIMDEVREYCGRQTDYLKLRLRRKEYKEFIVYGRTDAFANWKVDLGIVFKKVEPKGYADDLGIIENDELIGINSNSNTRLHEKSINGIKTKFGRDVTLCIRRAYAQGVFKTPRRDDDVGSDYSSPPASVIVPVNPSRPVGSGNPPFFGKRTISFQESFDINPIERENTVEVRIAKRSFEFFGWQFVGGNKVGIFVKSVENHLPASKAKIQPGWKLLEVEGFILENVAFCYALELINYFGLSESITCIFEKTSVEEYQKQIEILPHDSFYIKTLKRGKNNDKDIPIFFPGQTLHVTDTSQSAGQWIASFPNSSPIMIPHMTSSFSKIENHHVYEEIPEPPSDQSNSNKSSFWKRQKSKQTEKDSKDRLYELLDEVEVKRGFDEPPANSISG